MGDVQQTESTGSGIRLEAYVSWNACVMMFIMEVNQADSFMFGGSMLNSIFDESFPRDPI